MFKVLVLIWSLYQISWKDKINNYDINENNKWLLNYVWWDFEVKQWLGRMAKLLLDWRIIVLEAKRISCYLEKLGYIMVDLEEERESTKMKGNKQRKT